MSNKGTIDNPLRVFSYGNGLDSFSVLISQIMGKLKTPFDFYIFANVGEKAENPETLRHFNEVVLPLCKEHNINMIEVCRKDKNGNPIDLYDYIVDNNHLGVPIPLFIKGSGYMGRKCTSDWKVIPMMKWLDDYVKSNQIEYVEIGIGFNLSEQRRRARRGIESESYHNYITLDENTEEQNLELFPSGDLPRQRIKTKTLPFYRRYVYPIMDDLVFNRVQCVEFITNSVYEKPESSECWFCPFHTASVWVEMKKKKPELYEKSIELEKIVNSKLKPYYTGEKGRSPLPQTYFHRGAIPLIDIPNQLSIFDVLEDDLSCEFGCGV